jgi:hypothetical protein
LTDILEKGKDIEALLNSEWLGLGNSQNNQGTYEKLNEFHLLS